MIRFKKAMCADGNEVVLRLYVPNEARIYPLPCIGANACRASKAKVLQILDVYGAETALTTAYSEFDPSFKYTAGEWVCAEDCNEQNGSGIYMWKHFNEALSYWPGSRNWTWRERRN